MRLAAGPLATLIPASKSGNFSVPVPESPLVSPCGFELDERCCEDCRRCEPFEMECGIVERGGQADTVTKRMDGVLSPQVEVEVEATAPVHLRIVSGFWVGVGSNEARRMEIKIQSPSVGVQCLFRELWDMESAYEIVFV
jgi:hypothetical protein